MYRQTNNENGFQTRNTNEMGYLSNDKYPAQKEDYLGKVICLNVKVQDTQEYISRFKVPECKDFQDYLYQKNSGIIDFFEVLRYDTEEPFRAILMDRFGRVISTYTTELERTYDLVPSYMNTEYKKRAKKLGFKYLPINPTNDKDVFFDSYLEDKIHVYHVQDLDILGVEVYTEYDTDLLTLDKTHNIAKKRESYKFTPEMKALMLKRNNKLFGMPDEIYRSYPNYYNIHAKSYVDDPIRAINKGYIIRADQNGQIDPELIVMEVVDGKARFVTQHEARFYYNTDNMVRHNIYELVRSIVPIPEYEEDEEEEIIEPDIPDEPVEPEEPSEPTEPDVPVNPEEPDTPSEPDVPDTPEEPENPDLPVEPTETDEPVNPDIPEEPEEPEIPEDNIEIPEENVVDEENNSGL